MTEGQWIDCAKGALPGINPDSIRRHIVVANVQVGRPITINVTKHCRQSPIPKGWNRFAFLVQKNARLELNGREVTMPIVAVKSVHLWQFPHSSIRQCLKAVFEP